MEYLPSNLMVFSQITRQQISKCFSHPDSFCFPPQPGLSHHTPSLPVWTHLLPIFSSLSSFNPSSVKIDFLIVKFFQHEFRRSQYTTVTFCLSLCFYTEFISDSGAFDFSVNLENGKTSFPLSSFSTLWHGWEAWLFTWVLIFLWLCSREHY